MLLNWSLFRKVFITFEICRLTFSVYVGSAIHSARHRNRRQGLWRLTNKGHPWPDPFRCRLRPWTYDLGPHERNPPNREKPHIYWDISSTPGADGVAGELCHAVVLPLPDRFYRQSGPGDWGSEHRGYVCTKEESVWYRPVGHRDYFWTRARTVGGRFRRPG